MTRPSRDIPTVWGPNHTWLIDGKDDDGVGDQYGWKDMTANLGSAGAPAGATTPDFAVFRGGIKAYQFNKGDELYITFHPNHDVIPGEKFYPHIHWATNSTTDTGTVIWGIEYTIAEGFDTDAFPATSTIEMSYTFTANKQYQHLITECSDAQAITMPDVDSLILMRIYRKNDAADTFAGNVFGLTADIHYRAGKFATVGKRPNFNEAD